MPEGERFLHKKYQDLHTSSEVKNEQERRRIATEHDIEGQEPSEKPAEKIEHFLEVIGKTHGHHEDPRVLDRIKNSYHKQYVIKPHNIPQSHFNLQGEIALADLRKGDLVRAGVEIKTVKKKNEKGEEVEMRNFYFPEEMKKREITTVIANQEKSLDKWIDYLTSTDADVYPMWAKYFAFRSMVEMGKLVKTESEDGRVNANFQKRTKDTVALFPPLNPRALALTFDVLAKQVEQKGKPKKERQSLENKSKKLSDSEFAALLSTESFAKIYSQFLIEMPEYSTEGLREIRGEWKTYKQNSDPTELVNSLEGYPLEWCTAAPDTAKTHLEGGDFHVYYSLNEQGEAKVPRLAIRMEGNKIAEPPRGIAPNQNLDPYITPILGQKLSEFGSEGEKYKERIECGKKFTEVEEKMKQGKKLGVKDLIFLYEINSPIEGFGYQRDPRIEELRAKRNPEEDMPFVFECSSEKIARTPEEINEHTKAYVGNIELKAGFFQTFPKDIRYIYKEFPEKRLDQRIQIGGKTAEELEATLKQAGSSISDNAEYMLKSKKFVTGKEQEDITIIRLSVADLGFENGATIAEIMGRQDDQDAHGNPAPFTSGMISRLGLELCPAETGPHYRLQYKNQPFGEWIRVGMKPISDSSGDPSVFVLSHSDDGLWLGDSWARPGSRCSSGGRFAFRLGK